jgi:hypothetical protein
MTQKKNGQLLSPIRTVKIPVLLNHVLLLVTSKTSVKLVVKQLLSFQEKVNISSNTNQKKASVVQHTKSYHAKHVMKALARISKLRMSNALPVR